MSRIEQRNSVRWAMMPTQRNCQLIAVAVGVSEDEDTMTEGSVVQSDTCCAWALVTITTHKTAASRSISWQQCLRLNKSARKGR